MGRQPDAGCGEAAGSATNTAVMALGRRWWGADGVGLPGVEPFLGHFNKYQVGDNHAEQNQKESKRQSGETQGVGNGRKRQYGTDSSAGDGHDEHRKARSTFEERHPSGADEKHHQRLGGKRFDEPAAAELLMAGVQYAQHDEEGEKVKD